MCVACMVLDLLVNVYKSLHWKFIQFCIGLSIYIYQCVFLH